MVLRGLSGVTFGEMVGRCRAEGFARWDGLDEL